jgi:hypothetical protein
MGQAPQEPDFVAEVFSPQLAMKQRPAGGPPGAPLPPAERELPRRRAVRPNTDTWMAWNALPNEYIAAIGTSKVEPVLGGSVSKLFARGVLRFPSSVQRIEFRTDNISSENQGVLVEAWACWRVLDAKSAIAQLDFSDADDPMGKTSKTLAIQCAGIMKGLISIKSVSELLKRREDLIDALRKKLKPTEERWGLSFDEIGISEVQVLSQEVFENMQRPFRNEAREIASTSDLETEERVVRKKTEQHERISQIESEGERKARELQARSQTTIRSVEIEEERKRLDAEKSIASLKMEEEKRQKSLAADLQRRLQAEAIQAEADAQLRQITAKGARDAAQVEAERALVTARLELDKARIESSLEITRAEQAVATAKREAEAAARRAGAVLEAEVLRTEMAVQAEREQARLVVAERDRAIGGQFSDAEIRMQLVGKLPEIAGNIKVGDVRWYGGGTADSGPLGIIGRAVEEVLDVARANGIELGRKPADPT